VLLLLPVLLLLLLLPVLGGVPGVLQLPSWAEAHQPTQSAVHRLHPC
jgi:hypothetical protein